MTDTNHKTGIMHNTPVWLGYRYLIYTHQTNTDTPRHRVIAAVWSNDPATCEHTEGKSDINSLETKRKFLVLAYIRTAHYTRVPLMNHEAYFGHSDTDFQQPVKSKEFMNG